MDRIKDVSYNPFWSDFIKSVDALFKTDIISHRDVIHETPLWFNPDLRNDFIKSWYDKGIRKIIDLVDTYGRPMDLHRFQKLSKSKQISWNMEEDFPESNSPLPSNSYLNIVIHMDKKVCLIYTKCSKVDNTTLLRKHVIKGTIMQTFH